MTLSVLDKANFDLARNWSFELDESLFPYYRAVPKDPRENARFRVKLMQEIEGSASKRRQLRKLCEQDLLFWVNALCFVEEPRGDGDKSLPFITYEYQDWVFQSFLKNHGRRPVVVVKSRTMGLTWQTMAYYKWRADHRDRESFLIVSRVREMVDEYGSPDTLFAKLDFLHEHLPECMRDPIDRKEMKYRNLRTKGVITGTATTATMGRGGRRSGAFGDEWAFVPRGMDVNALTALQAVTRSRIFVSTPNGADGAFYEMMTDSSNVDRLRVHWSLHPEYRRGLYCAVDGKLRILDTDYEFPSDYEFITDGKLRSPYYDAECRSPGVTPKMIAREHDLDFGGSEDVYFDPAVLDRLTATTVRPPMYIGVLDYTQPPDVEPTRFVEMPSGPWRLWHPITMGGVPPQSRRYFVAVDVAQGTGASNSAISVGDALTGEKVAEFADPRVRPERLAEIAVATCRWYAGDDEKLGAKLIWESRGPGMGFGDRVVELGHENLYRRVAESKVTRERTDKIGWSPSKPANEALMQEYRRALSGGDFVTPSFEEIQECRDYLFTTAGILHRRAFDAEDPSGARENHGDRVRSAALLWALMREGRAVRPAPKEGPAPAGSLAHRRTIRARAMKAERW